MYLFSRPEVNFLHSSRKFISTFWWAGVRRTSQLRCGARSSQNRGNVVSRQSKVGWFNKRSWHGSGLAQRSQMMAARSANSPSGTAPKRPCLFVFEGNLRVLNYLKRTFSALYDLHLFSEEKAFLRDLERTDYPSLVLLAWAGI